MQIDKDTLRAALEGAIDALKLADTLQTENFAAFVRQGIDLGQVTPCKQYRKAIADLDTLAAKLGGGE